MKKEFIWAEKYRPKILKDLVLPKDYLLKFKSFIEKKEIPNLGLWGSPGIGKDSLTNVIVNYLNTDTLIINGSKENGIDVVRYQIDEFARQVPQKGKFKLIVISEFDMFTYNAMTSLRYLIEETSSNARFIVSGNYKEKIIDPILNRFYNIDFDMIFQEQKYFEELRKRAIKRCTSILDNENIEYDKDDVTKVVNILYPSIRQMLIFLQNNIVDGKLVINELPLDFNSELIKVIEDGDYSIIRDFVDRKVTNEEILFKTIYENIIEMVDEDRILDFVKMINDYQDSVYMAKVKKIPLLAMLLEMRDYIK